jgi:hypothetical protein
VTLHDRVCAFQRTYAKWPASWPRIVREQDRDVLYATWLIGNDYRNATKFYGSYPPGYLERVDALFPDALSIRTLHVFSGSLPSSRAWRLDINPKNEPDVVGSVYEVAHLFPGQSFDLLLADPPYSAADAAKYETAMVDRRRALAALAQVTRVGGHLVWLDTVWPMHRKAEWLTVGRITIVRSTNHRIRMATIFERTTA